MGPQSRKVDSQNVYDIRRSHNVYREYHEQLERGTDSRRKKLSRGENPERDLPGKCAITFTIFNSNDATESHAPVNSDFINSKINLLMYMDDIKLFDENEKELETLIEVVRIYIENIGIEFGIEKCAMLIRKSGKRQMTERIELQNQEKIRTPGEKKTYKYLGILKADIIKHVEMKEFFC